ncbi:unnamed protein product, partial [Mesorhabditis spiculigera]
MLRIAAVIALACVVEGRPFEDQEIGGRPLFYLTPRGRPWHPLSIDNTDDEGKDRPRQMRRAASIEEPSSVVEPVIQSGSLRFSVTPLTRPSFSNSITFEAADGFRHPTNRFRHHAGQPASKTSLSDFVVRSPGQRFHF